jgi:hypothetical protein
MKPCGSLPAGNASKQFLLNTMDMQVGYCALGHGPAELKLMQYLVTWARAKSVATGPVDTVVLAKHLALFPVVLEQAFLDQLPRRGSVFTHTNRDKKKSRTR